MKIVIVGAGIAGLGIGWRLRQAGAEVVILERAQPARGATWAAAGMLAVLGEIGDAQGAEAEFAHQARDLWADFAGELEQASGLAVDYREDGALLAALSEDEAKALPATKAAQRLEPAKARALEPMLADEVVAALWAPGEAQVDNRAVGEALARAFVGAGGVLIANETAVRIETDGARALAVRTPFNLYEADAFVLAAGAWTGRIEGLPACALPPVKPVKGEMLALAPSQHGILPGRVVWGNGVYLVPRRDRLLVGATMQDAGFDTSLTREAADWLLDHAAKLMPALREWTVADHWAGLRPGSPDGLPMLGPTAIEGLYAATGQFRNGILFAPAIADLLCRIVLKRAGGPPAFDPRRFS